MPLSQVRLLAHSVMLSESVLPFPMPTDSAATAAAHLRALAELVAAAGLPARHTIQLNVDLVCWRDPAGGGDVKFAAPGAGGMIGDRWKHQVAAAGPPGSGSSSGGSVHVTARAAAPQLEGPLWPAALAASARSLGPELALVLQGQPEADVH